MVIHLPSAYRGWYSGGPHPPIQQMWARSKMSNTIKQYAQLLNILITAGIICKGQIGGPRKEGSSSCGVGEESPQSVQGRACARPIQELSRPFIYLGPLLALLWLLGLRDLPGQRSWHWHPPAFEWGGHLHKGFGYSILSPVLASRVSEDPASSLERLCV